MAAPAAAAASVRRKGRSPGLIKRLSMMGKYKNDEYLDDQDGPVEIVRVFSMSDFTDTSGWSYDGWKDTTDPYVKLKLGKEERRTKVITDAGGCAIFNETFAFHKDNSEHHRTDSVLKIWVYDDDPMNDELLGEAEIDLDKQPHCDTVHDLHDLTKGMPYRMVGKDGKATGKVFLAFAHAESADEINTGLPVRKTKLRAHGLMFEHILSDPYLEKIARSSSHVFDGNKRNPNRVDLSHGNLHEDIVVNRLQGQLFIPQRLVYLHRHAYTCVCALTHTSAYVCTHTSCE